MPVILEKIGDWDVWRHSKKGTTLESWALNMQMYVHGLRPEEAYNWWETMFTSRAGAEGLDYIERIFVQPGLKLIEPERKRNRSLFHNFGFEAILVDGDREYSVLAVNGKGNSLIAIDYFKPERHDLVMLFYFAGTNFVQVRLYADNSDDVDCNSICHSLGYAGPIPSGGGHKGAGGFHCTWEYLNTILNNQVSLKFISKQKRLAKEK